VLAGDTCAQVKHRQKAFTTAVVALAVGVCLCTSDVRAEHLFCEFAKYRSVIWPGSDGERQL
jgi:hypothetical protein